MIIGGNLERIPPEIEGIEALEVFEPYGSHKLHWLPYEIMNCKKLVVSCVSTRALYGNYKYRPPFPNLHSNVIRFFDSSIRCGICKKEAKNEVFEQYWISLNIATDVVPLLVNICSSECHAKLPIPPENYVRYAHKGGLDLLQPKEDEEEV